MTNPMTTTNTATLTVNAGACERFLASTEDKRLQAARGLGAYYCRKGFTRDESVAAVIKTIPVAKTACWTYLEQVSRGYMVELADQLAA